MTTRENGSFGHGWRRDWWQRLSLRERILAGVTGIAVLMAAVHYGVIRPYLAYRQQLEDSIVREANRLEKVLRQVERGPETERRLSQLRQRYQAAAARLIPGTKPQLAAAQLQQQVQSLATQSQMEIVSARVLKIKQVGEFQRAAVQLQLRGHLPAMAAFLAAVEYDAWSLTIDRLDIRGSRRSGRYRRRSGRHRRRRIQRRIRRRPPLTVTVVIGGFLQSSAPTMMAQDGAPGAGRDKDA